MPYTKQQLIDAFCAARGCQPSDLPNIEIKIQARLDKQREEIQARLDKIPTTAKQEMKNVALNYLNMQSAQQVISDNDGVSL